MRLLGRAAESLNTQVSENKLDAKLVYFLAVRRRGELSLKVR